MLVSENENLTSEASSLKIKLDAMSGMDKKHDLLDLELEEAEARITSLTGCVTSMVATSYFDLKYHVFAASMKKVWRK